MVLFSLARISLSQKGLTINGGRLMQNVRDCHTLRINYSQRRAMSPAFGLAAIRRLTPIFFDAVNQVRSIQGVISSVDSEFALGQIKLGSKYSAKWSRVCDHRCATMVSDQTKPL
jgi:hypothetical protein